MEHLGYCSEDEIELTIEYAEQGMERHKGGR